MPTQPESTFLRRTLVLIPALNEEACIAPTIRRWRELGVRHVRVVDNHSTDGTSQVARGAGAEVVYEPVRAYGAAVWRGLSDWPEEADWVLFSSADGSDRIGLDDLPAWQSAVDGGADLVLGDRTRDAESRRNLKRIQRLGNSLCCAVIAAGWGRRFHDMAALRLVRSDWIRHAGMEDRGFGWNVEMQVRALIQGRVIVEIPVLYHPRLAGASKISGNLLGTLRAGAGILRMLGLVWRCHRRRRQIAAVPTIAASQAR